MTGGDLVRLNWLDDFLPQFRAVLDSVGESGTESPIEDVQDNIEEEKWIQVTGEGIKSAVVGKPSSFLIDYSGADRGSLAIETRGPSKLELDCDYRKFTTVVYSSSNLIMTSRSSHRHRCGILYAAYR